MEQNPEHSDSSFEKYRGLATEILRNADWELRTWRAPGGADQLHAEEQRALEFGRDGFSLYQKQIPDEVQRRFRAHGIVRRDETGNLAAFLSILETGILKGDIAPLSGSPMQNAYTSADFVILSRIDDRMVSSNSIDGLVVRPGAYVVNTRLYPIVPEIKKRFPEANVIRADELLDYVGREFSKQASKA